MANQIRECVCGKCGESRLTIPGTRCSCGGLLKAQSTSGGSDDMIRKAYGLEDTDLRKAR